MGIRFTFVVMLRARNAAVILLVLASALVDACSNEHGFVDPSSSSDSAIVTDPVLVQQSSSSAVFATPGVTNGVEIAYVSLAAGTIPDGQIAVVRNTKSTSTVTVIVSDGGFDPVPVAAGAGDVIEITVQPRSGPAVSLTRAVPNRRPPVVVRADPPPRKRDVPLNAAIVIVFSEPVDPASLNTGSVQLRSGATVVSGVVRLLGGTATAAVFQPSGFLEPNTDYHVALSGSIRDLSGDALVPQDSAYFTTGTTVEGFADRIHIVPDTGAILIGSQLQLRAIAQDSFGTVLSGVPASRTLKPMPAVLLRRSLSSGVSAR